MRDLFNQGAVWPKTLLPSNVPSDDFVKPDSNSSLGSLVNPVTPWTVLSGTWGTSTIRDTSPAHRRDPKTWYVAVADAGAGKQDCRVQADIIQGFLSPDVGLALRVTR